MATLLRGRTPVQRQTDHEDAVTRLSGSYLHTEELDGGVRKRTVLFLNVNQVSAVGNYRSYLDEGDGFDAHDSGDLRAERVEGADGIRYDATSDAGSWMLRFDVRQTGGLASLQRGGVLVPLMVTGLDGVDRRFRRRGRQAPVTDVNVRDAGGRAAQVDEERRRGLSPEMLDGLAVSARQVLERLRRHPTGGLSSQRRLARRGVAREFDEALAGYSGGLRRQARSELFRRLARHRVRFLDEVVRADRAVLESIGDEPSSPTSQEHAAGPFVYRLVFRGIRGRGRAVAGVQLATGALQVTAYRASREESTTDEAWTSHYHFEEIRVSAAAGGGLGGGVYWKTFHASSPVEWTQDDFRSAMITVFGVQGPHASASARAGPGSADLANCQAYQFEGMSLSAGSKVLELQADEKTFECASDLTAGDDEGGGTVGQNDEGGVGVDVEGHLGQLESGLGSIQGLPGQDYSDERQQLPDSPATRGTTEVVPSPGQAAYAVASSALDREMMVHVTEHLGSYQDLLRDPAVPVRIVGHASSGWRGRSDPIAGNRALSRERATRVEAMIRRAFELRDDRLLEVHWLGDQEARAAGGTPTDDDPAYRRVDVHIGGVRTVPIRY